jgi:hypothetical protein
VQQGVELKRLRDEVGRSLLDGVNGIFDGAVPRNHDRHDVGIALDGRVEYLTAVDPRQAEVGDEDVEGEIAEPAKRLFAVVGLFDRVALVGQTLSDSLAQRLLVIHDEEMFNLVRHLVRLAVF